MENVNLSDLMAGMPYTLKTRYQREVEEYKAAQEPLFAAEYYYGNTRGVEKLRPAEEGGQCPSES